MRRTGDAGVDACEVAWRVAVTPGALAVDAVIVAGAWAALAVVSPVALADGVVGGGPSASNVAAAIASGF